MFTTFLKVPNILSSGTCDALISLHCKIDFNVFTNNDLSHTVEDALCMILNSNVKIPLPWYIRKYNEYETIGVHMDGHKKYKDQSSFGTIIIYLNDEFIGGETCIVNHTFFETIVKDTIVPVKGSGLLLKQDVFHMSNPSPNCKYILRNDVFSI
jgi:hypothetical protein